MRLFTAAAVAVVVGGAIITIAASPILSTSVSKPQLSSVGVAGLSVNPAFHQPQRAQSSKADRLLEARFGQDRARPLTAAEIRMAALKPKIEQVGQSTLASLQRKLVNRQIPADTASGQLLAGLPAELMPKTPPATDSQRSNTAIVPTTALAAVTPSTTPADKNPFKLVLQGVDDSRSQPGEIPLPEKRPGGTALAYASFGHDDMDDLFGEVPEQTHKVAVYDISAGKVYMPDGEVMEAHSGRGKYRDDPDHTHVKMAGAVPAATYKLTPRESLFHGVPALRMTSVDGTNPLGRTGILAHTYMLRTPGDSHGCLVFKDYYKFLKAYRQNKVDYIVAVPSLKSGMEHKLASRAQTS